MINVLRNRRPTSMIPIVFACLGLFLGALVAGTPQLGLACLGLILFFTLAHMPAHLWAAVAVCAAVLSRIMVAGTGLPSSINFVHFPLALAAGGLAFLFGQNHTSLTRKMELGLGAFLVLCGLSTAINGGEIARPILTWMVFSEPFLILYAILRTLRSKKEMNFLWILLFFCAFVQVPLAIFQAIVFGSGDPTGGTFIGMSSASHTCGGVALIGVIGTFGKAIQTKNTRSRFFWVSGGVLLLSTPILSDAKQAIVAFVVSALLFSFGLIRNIGRKRFPLLLLLLLCVITFTTFSLSSGFQSYWRNVATIPEGLQGKKESIRIIFQHLYEKPGGLFVGLGPGNSVSRVGLMAHPGYGKEDSPVGILGLKEAPTTQAVMASTESNWIWTQSSLWNGISSWNGLIGDVGIFGLALYLFLCLILVIHSPPRAPAQSYVLKTTLLMTGILAAVSSWLEEPGFTLPAVLLIGLTLLEKDPSTGKASSTNQLPVQS